MDTPNLHPGHQVPVFSYKKRYSGYLKALQQALLIGPEAVWTLYVSDCAMVRSLLIEAIVEHTRLTVASSVPSRLDCRFCFADIENAIRFLTGQREQWSIYRCEPGISSEIVGVFDMGLLQIPNGRSFEESLDLASIWAKNYWESRNWPPDKRSKPEVMVCGELAICEPVWEHGG